MISELYYAHLVVEFVELATGQVAAVFGDDMLFAIESRFVGILGKHLQRALVVHSSASTTSEQHVEGR